MVKSFLATHWVAGSLFMALALLLLLPAGIPGGDGAVLLVYLASPIYMLHQVEEHLGDRFRRYVNTVVFGGVEALSTSDVLVINLPGVWGINLAALYAAHFAGAGWGLVAGYMILINGVSHVAMALHLRGYNPGLVTAGSGVAIQPGCAPLTLARTGYGRCSPPWTWPAGRCSTGSVTGNGGRSSWTSASSCAAASRPGGCI